MAVEDGDIVAPGAIVGSKESRARGRGVSDADGVLVASLVGVVSTEPKTDANSAPVLSVRHTRDQNGNRLVHVPAVGMTVLGRVSKITPRSAFAEILVSDGVPLRAIFKGSIRREDVRQMETGVEIYRSFRPGDIIRAEVIGLGDRHAYALSTARNELGVIHAVSESGAAMLPVSWEEMQCSATGAIELRKVAKP